MNDLFKASNPLTEVMCADDTNLFLSNKYILIELLLVQMWNLKMFQCGLSQQTVS